MDERREAQMRRRLGMTRRDLIRRGAIVGGTLVWTIPVISTISRAHIADPTSPAFICCECRPPIPGNQQPGDERCTGSGVGSGPVQCTTAATADSPSNCSAFCAGFGLAYCFHTSPTPISCVDNACGDHG